MRRFVRSRGISATMLVLSALAVAALLLQDGSLPHLHDDSEPGLYNHDHDLTLRLFATVGGGAPVPDGAPAVSLLPHVATALPAIVSRAAASPIRDSSPRAPPPAS